jgi:hypothetical protein
MNPQTLLRRVALSAAVAGVVAIGAPAAAQNGAAATAKIGPSGVGGVKLGKTYSELHRKGLVGGIRRGCELGGPNTRAARLRPPLAGSVDFTLTSPRRVTNITVAGGATARGVGIGATVADIKAAYPKAKLDHSTDETFGITLVKVPKSGGGRLSFAVDTTTHKVTLIGIPFIAFCE